MPTLACTAKLLSLGRAGQLWWFSIYVCVSADLRAQSISSTQDPVTKGGHVRFQELVPGARTTRHVTIRGAGHFIQEEKPDELAQVCSLLLAPGPWLDDPSGGVLPLMNAARTHTWGGGHGAHPVQVLNDFIAGKHALPPGEVNPPRRSGKSSSSGPVKALAAAAVLVATLGVALAAAAAYKRGTK
jgi:hypothetical protein